MAKSKGRLLAELLASDGKVKESKSALEIQGGKIKAAELPTITNSQLENSSITIAGEETALGSSVSLNTGHITEHTNFKYYTDARVRSAISASGDLSYNSSTGVISFSASGSPVVSVNTQTGSVVLDTGDISESGNLYFTNARARSAISVSGNAISYNSSTGVITANYEESPTFTGHTAVQGNFSVGNSSAGNQLFKRPSANYIWADQTGGYFIFGTSGRSTSYANRAMALTTDNDADFGRDVNVTRQVSAPIYYDKDNTGRYFNGNGTSVLQNLQTVGEIYATNGMKTLNSAGDGWNNTINRNSGSPIGNFPGGINLTSGTITTTGNITSGSVTAGDSSTGKFLRAHYSDGSYMTLEGYGLVMNRATSYIRPSSDGNKTLYVGGVDDSLDWANIYFRSLNGLYITGNKFIDANRQFIANSRITFDYNDHYLEAGTGTITLKNDSDASLVTLGQASQFNGTVKINSNVSGVGDINLGTAISGHSSSDPARITATTQGQLYLDSTNGQHIYLGWWNGSGQDIISEMNFRGPSFKDRNDTSYFLNPAGASNIRNLVIKGTTSDSSTDALHIRNAAGASQSYFRNDGTVVIGGSQYLYVTASGGAYFSNSIKARGGINNDQGDLTLSDTVQVGGPLIIQGSGSEERYLAFTLDGKNSAFSGSNNAFIFNGQGSTGDYLAGALYFQSRSNSVSREIGFITGTSPAKRLVINDSGITVTGTISGNLTGTVTGTATQASNLNNHTTNSLTEGSNNLYYTDARVGSYLSSNGYATQSTIVAAITDSAPSTLDTLNELAAALGDDANFSTTVTNSIATKAPLASPSLTGNPSISGNLMMTNTTSRIELGAYLKLYAATASNTGTIAINANYGGAQTDNWTPDYSGDSNAGMWLLRQASGGSGIMQVLQKKHGTTGGSHARSSFTKTAEFHHDGHFYGRNLRSERYYSSDNTAYYTDPSETSAINKLLVNGANNNSGKADFAVSAGGSHSQVSLNGNQVQAGGTDMNWNSKFAYDGNTKLGGWDNSIYIFTQGGSSATAKNIYFQPQADGGSATTRLTIHGDNGAVIANTQMRAPIFYDSDNTAYYSDPHGLSKMSQASIGTTSAPSSGYALRMGGDILLDGNHIHHANQVHFTNGTRFQTNSDSVLNFYGNNTSAVQLNFGTGAAERNGAIYATSDNDIGFLDSDNNWAYRLRRDNDHNWYINNVQKLRLHADTSASYFSAPGEFRFRPNGSTSNWVYINTDYLSHSSDIRAPIFYDSQNTSYYIDPASTSFVNQFSASKLLVDNNLVLDLTNNNTERGPWNPIVTSIRNTGHKLHIDEEFDDGTNNVGVYNNSGGNAITITRVNASSDPGLNAPNSTGKLLKIAYLSSNSSGVSPGYGGFVQNIPSEDNHTFVQIFQAKLPSGRSLNIAENSQGSNATSYWLTNNVGTGKFEWYARVSHCGDSGSFSSGGHIYVSGGSNADFNWYLASCTVYDVTESHRLYGREFLATQNMKAPIFYDSNNTSYYTNPASTSILASASIGTTSAPSGGYGLRTTSIQMHGSGSLDYIGQLHFNDNVRFFDDGNDSYLNFKYGDTNNGGIIVQNGNGAQKGILYASNDGFGLLSADGSWAVKTTDSATTIEHGLTVNGNVTHSGLTMTSGTDVDQIYSVTVSATLTTSWQDTGIDSSDLATGTYIVQIFVDNDNPRRHYNEFYSGVMSWYSGSTNSTEVDEIALHRAGHAPNAGNFYIRTERRLQSGDSGTLMLQMRGTENFSSNSNYVFKFRRMI